MPTWSPATASGTSFWKIWMPATLELMTGSPKPITETLSPETQYNLVRKAPVNGREGTLFDRAPLDGSDDDGAPAGDRHALLHGEPEGSAQLPLRRPHAIQGCQEGLHGAKAQLRPHALQGAQGRPWPNSKGQMRNTCEKAERKLTGNEGDVVV